MADSPPPAQLLPARPAVAAPKRPDPQPKPATPTARQVERPQNLARATAKAHPRQDPPPVVDGK